MPILIDGHNLIGRIPTLSLSDPDDEEQLIALLRAWRIRNRKTVTVVFDSGGAPGAGETRRQAGLEVVFSPPGSSADDVILRRVQRSRNPAGLTVVTSDRALARQVAYLGAKVRPAEDVASELSNTAEKPQRDRPLTAEELDDWLALFDARK